MDSVVSWQMDGKKCFVLCSQPRFTWFYACSDMLSIPYTFVMCFAISLSATLEPSNIIIITTLAPEWKQQTTQYCFLSVQGDRECSILKENLHSQ